VNIVASTPVPDPLPSAITRPRQHVDVVLAQSIAETGEDGRAALAWQWALTGTRPSPITLSLTPGRPPTREELLAEADADPEGSTAPHGVPTDYCDQIGEARRVLRWLTGDSDEIPVDRDNRGQLIGARDDYARTDDEIRHLRDSAQRGLEALGPCGTTDPGNTRNPWQQNPARMNAAWFRGIRDLLEWVLGDRPTAPLSGRTIHRPTIYDLGYEESAAQEVIRESGQGHHLADPDSLPPHWGEAIQATIHWLRGEITSVPGGPYDGSPGTDTVRGPSSG
jgi:hypothetical protein